MGLIGVRVILTWEIKLSTMKNTVYLSNVPKFLRRDSWMRDHDFDPWFRILTWAVGLDKQDVMILRILLKRIRSMYISQGKRRNFRFVYSYLKEAYTICVSVKVSSTYTPKIGVAVGRSTGFPLIIPGRIRERMLSDRRLYIAVMTLLGIHRVIPWWPEVDLSTVTDPFKGTRTTLPGLSKAKAKLMRLAGTTSVTFRNLVAKPLFPQSAGPNGSVAWKEVVSDAIGILRYPSYLIKLLHWFILTQSWTILVSFMLTLIGAALLVSLISLNMIWCNLAIFLRKFLVEWRLDLIKRNQENRTLIRWFFYDFHDTSLLTCLIHILWFLTPRRALEGDIVRLKDFNLSRLAVVYNTAGKARVIGITNYWVQVALYPLHKEIFRFLGRLPTDGTYDQLGPVWALRPDGSNKYYSYDLSAATDRLPRSYQVDVLSQFVDPRLSKLWGSLVDMPFTFDDSVVKYAVGQPMGAYSSWAMLALTHHMIVQSSSKNMVSNYAILGDDVIVPESVATQYLALMQSLGVSISLAKSIVSEKYIEFAKRVRTLNGEDLSIIGPGLIMSAVRYRWLSALVLADSIKKGLQRWTDAPNLLRKLPGHTSDPEAALFGSLVLFGPKALLSDSQANAVFPPGKARALSQLTQESSWVLSHIVDFLIKEQVKERVRSYKTATDDGNMVRSLMWSHYKTKFGLILGLVMFLTFWVSPSVLFLIKRIGDILESEVPWAKYSDRSRWDLPSIILDCLDGHPELHWSLQEAPTNQKVKSSRLFFDRLMKSFPWMDGLRPRVSIPFKGATVDRPAVFWGDNSLAEQSGPSFGMAPVFKINISKPAPPGDHDWVVDEKTGKTRKRRIWDITL